MFARTRLLSRMNFRSLNNKFSSTVAATSGAKRGVNMPRLAILGGGSLGVMLWIMPSTAACMQGEDSPSGDDGKKPSKGPMDDVEKIIMTTIAPLATKLGYGGIMGVFSGIALKKVGEVLAIGIGVVFVGLQFLQYKGLIDIDYGTVKEKVIDALDADGDGKLDANDLLIYWNQLKGILSHSLPSSSGFATGFAIGLYYM